MQKKKQKKSKKKQNRVDKKNKKKEPVEKHKVFYRKNTGFLHEYYKWMNYLIFRLKCRNKKERRFICLIL